MNKTKFFTVLVLVGMALSSARVFADTTPTNEGIDKLLQIICDIFSWIYTFALIAGVIMVLMAAFQYITSNGNTEKVDTATKTILYAVIGIAIAIMAKGVPLIVGNLVQVQDSSLQICK